MFFLIGELDYIFKKHYLKNDTTLWSPKVQTIEEFVQEHVDIKISDDLADQINLNYLLYNVLENIKAKSTKLLLMSFIIGARYS